MNTQIGHGNFGEIQYFSSFFIAKFKNYLHINLQKALQCGIKPDACSMLVGCLTYIPQTNYYLTPMELCKQQN